MKILFWLYKSRINKAGQAPVMMRITIHGQRISFSTNILLEMHSWDPVRQRVKGNSDLSNAHNNIINTLRNKAWNEYNDNLRRGTTPSPINIRAVLTGQTKVTVTLLEAINHYLKYLEGRIGIDVAVNTVKKYKTLLKKTIAYLSHIGITDKPLISVNITFITDFDTYMRAAQKISNNAVAKNMQQLKRIIRICMENNWLEKNPFVHYRCKLKETDRGYLTAKELKMMADYSIHNPRLEKVKDIFIFCCYTGLSYADVSMLRIDHLEEDNEGITWIRFHRTKTGSQSIIPLLPIPKSILIKYQMFDKISRALLPIISNQNLNKYLKELAKLIGIEKRVSMHLARHTFATTVTLEAGIDVSTVSKMLGHKNIKTTQIYAKVTQLKIASDMKRLIRE